MRSSFLVVLGTAETLQIYNSKCTWSYQGHGGITCLHPILDTSCSPARATFVEMKLLFQNLKETGIPNTLHLC
jgi:hypothetical protein